MKAPATAARRGRLAATVYSAARSATSAGSTRLASHWANATTAMTRNTVTGARRRQARGSASKNVSSPAGTERWASSALTRPTAKTANARAPSVTWTWVRATALHDSNRRVSALGSRPASGGSRNTRTRSRNPRSRSPSAPAGPNGAAAAWRPAAGGGSSGARRERRRRRRTSVTIVITLVTVPGGPGRIERPRDDPMAADVQRSAYAPAGRISPTGLEAPSRPSVRSTARLAPNRRDAVHA